MKPLRPETIARARSLRRTETSAETALWSELRHRRLNGFRFVRQFPVEAFVVDFACRSERLVVELDGHQHAEAASYDGHRTQRMNVLVWSVLRFWNDEILSERDATLETIVAVLEKRLTERCDGAGLLDGLRFAPATLSPQGRGMAPFSDRLGEGGR